MGQCKPQMVRTAIFLTDAMDQNLSAMALQTGESRSTLIRLALAKYMKANGYNPSKRPRVTVRH
jgi:hypothetical protein